jgi:hypothetical protein
MRTFHTFRSGRSLRGKLREQPQEQLLVRPRLLACMSRSGRNRLWGEDRSLVPVNSVQFSSVQKERKGSDKEGGEAVTYRTMRTFHTCRSDRSLREQPQEQLLARPRLRACMSRSGRNRLWGEGRSLIHVSLLSQS